MGSNPIPSARPPVETALPILTWRATAVTSSPGLSLAHGEDWGLDARRGLNEGRITRVRQFIHQPSVVYIYKIT